MGRKCEPEISKRRVSMNVSIRADLVGATTMYANVTDLTRSAIVEQAVYEYLVSRRVIEAERTEDNCPLVELPRTNGGRIRAMSNEELAKRISGIEQFALTTDGAWSPEQWLDWLKQEVHNA